MALEFRIKKSLFAIIALLYTFLFIQSGCHTSVKKNNATYSDSLKLGRYLFFDRRLSINNTRSCGTCHNPQFAFTDGYKRSLGVYADLHQRNTQPLFNLANYKYFTSADSTLLTPLQQMDNPLYSVHPAEMGVKGNEEKILKKIIVDKEYQKKFKIVSSAISWQQIKIFIAVFINSLQSYNSPYDKFLQGDSLALSIEAKAGKHLFFSEKLSCSKCHGGINFSTPSIKNEKGNTQYFFNTGLYNLGGNSSYPSYDQGLYQLTKNDFDKGKFRVPTLRNLLFTEPYYHDGSAPTLTDVVNNYAKGGREIITGNYKGDGSKNSNKHKLVNGFVITEKEKINLISFLQSLTDSSFVNNFFYQNPFESDETRKK